MSSHGDHNVIEAVRRASGSAIHLHQEHSLVDASSVHSYAHEEQYAFSLHLNLVFANESSLMQYLPLDVESNDLFTKVNDGILLAYLINSAVPHTINLQSLNHNQKEKKKVLNIYQKVENLNQAIKGAKQIGCHIVNIGSNDLLEGKPILVLALIWQIIRLQLLGNINLHLIPELKVLIIPAQGETEQTLLTLPPEQILIRWLNYHLMKSGLERRVSNLGADLMDCQVYLSVLHRLEPTLQSIQLPDLQQLADQQLTTTADTTTDKVAAEQLAKLVISHARELGVLVFLRPRDILEGNKRLHTAFVAQIFNCRHGLVLNERLSPHSMHSLHSPFASNEAIIITTGSRLSTESRGENATVTNALLATLSTTSAADYEVGLPTTTEPMTIRTATPPPLPVPPSSSSSLSGARLPRKSSLASPKKAAADSPTNSNSSSKKILRFEISQSEEEYDEGHRRLKSHSNSSRQHSDENSNNSCCCPCCSSKCNNCCTIS